MGEVVALREPPPGNLGVGARHALTELALTFPGTNLADAQRWSDYILFHLGARGYMVVPFPRD